MSWQRDIKEGGWQRRYEGGGGDEGNWKGEGENQKVKNLDIL